MALSTHVSAFSTGTTALSSTVSITDCPFQPKAVIFWRFREANSTVDAITGETNKTMVGFATGPSDRRVVFTRSNDGAASVGTVGYHSDAACIISANASAAIDGALDFVQFTSNGFDLIVDDVMPESARIHYMAFGGSDITNVATGSWTEPGSTGNHDITSLAFQPDAIFVVANQVGAAPPNGSAAIDSGLSIGAATGSSEQGVVMGNQDDAAAASNSVGFGISDSALALVSTGGTTITWKEAFVSFLSNGFTMNATARTAGARVAHFLAFKGGQYHVGNLTTATNTTPFTETGVGFQPTGAMFASAFRAESSGTTTTDHDHLGFGAASGASAQGAQSRIDKDAADPTDVVDAIEHDAVYVRITTTLATDTVAGIMELDSFDSDGMTLTMNDADPDAAFVWYLAVGSSAGGGGGTPVSVFLHHLRQQGIS